MTSTIPPKSGPAALVTASGSSGASALGSASATANSFGQAAIGTVYTTTVPTLITGIQVVASGGPTVTLSNTSTWTVTITAGSASATVIGKIDVIYNGSNLFGRVAESQLLLPGLQVGTGVAISITATVSQPFSGTSVFVAVFGVPVANLQSL